MHRNRKERFFQEKTREPRHRNKLESAPKKLIQPCARGCSCLEQKSAGGHADCHFGVGLSLARAQFSQVPQFAKHGLPISNDQIPLWRGQSDWSVSGEGMSEFGAEELGALFVEVGGILKILIVQNPIAGGNIHRAVLSG